MLVTRTAADTTPHPTTLASIHPALRSVPVTTGAVRGANASEVNAVAELVESIAPGVTVRAVSRKQDVFVVRAAAGGRTRLYRIPVDMIAHPASAAPKLDRAS